MQIYSVLKKTTPKGLIVRGISNYENFRSEMEQEAAFTVINVMFR